MQRSNDFLITSRRPRANPATSDFTTTTPALLLTSVFQSRRFFWFQNTLGYSRRCNSVILEGLTMEDGILFCHLVYFTIIRYILLPFWYIFSIFGMLDQEKSGSGPCLFAKVAIFETTCMHACMHAA
jgi:hypothetical protein